MPSYNETNALDPLISPGGSVRSSREKVTALMPQMRSCGSYQYESVARRIGEALARFATVIRDKPAPAVIAAAAGGLLAGFAMRRG